MPVTNRKRDWQAVMPQHCQDQMPFRMASSHAGNNTILVITMTRNLAWLDVDYRWNVLDRYYRRHNAPTFTCTYTLHHSCLVYSKFQRKQLYSLGLKIIRLRPVFLATRQLFAVEMLTKPVYLPQCITDLHGCNMSFLIDKLTLATQHYSACSTSHLSLHKGVCVCACTSRLVYDIVSLALKNSFKPKKGHYFVHLRREK